MGRDLFGLVLFLFRHVENAAQPLAVEREAVRLLEERAEHVEEVALDLDVVAHVGLTERQFGRLQELRLRDVLVHDHRELRLALTNRVLLVVQLHIEAVLVEVVEIMKQEIVHEFLEMHEKDSFLLRPTGISCENASQSRCLLKRYSTLRKQNPLFRECFEKEGDIYTGIKVSIFKMLYLNE